MQDFILGATAMACWIAMIFFLRFWRDTGDPLFGMFAAAFFLLGLARFGLALSHNLPEGDTYLYWLRLAAYVIILIAIVDKNRHKTA
jgi:hypothetical protein